MDATCREIHYCFVLMDSTSFYVQLKYSMKYILGFRQPEVKYLLIIKLVT